jgi:hypothetical protein
VLQNRNQLYIDKLTEQHASLENEFIAHRVLLSPK